METFKRYLHINRILDGKFDFTDPFFEGTCRDPSSFEVAVWSQEYNKKYEESLKVGLINDKDALKLAIKRGEWKEEWSISTIDKQIEMLDNQIGLNRFKLDTIERFRNKQIELQSEKYRIQKIHNNIMGMGTARFHTMKHIIFHKVVKLFSLSKGIIESEHDYFHLYNIMEKHELSVGQIRELARTAPWLTLYRAAKDNMGQLFSNLAKLTSCQESMLNWSQTYEYVFNHPERPDDFTIQNDAALDRWILSQNRRSKHTSKKDVGEVFIPTDKRGAKEVYEMNDDRARKIIKKQFNSLE